MTLAQPTQSAPPIAWILDFEGDIYIVDLLNRNSDVIRINQGEPLYESYALESISREANVQVKCDESGDTISADIIKGIHWIVKDYCSTKVPGTISDSPLRNAPSIVPGTISHSPLGNTPSIAALGTDIPLYSSQNIENIILNLQQSDRNTIERLQNDLWKYEYYGGGDVSGYFGPATQEAVRRFVQAGGKIRINYILILPQNIMPQSIPQNVRNSSAFSYNQGSDNLYSQTFHLLIPILRSEFPQRTQEVAALIPDREIEISGLENEFGFFIKVGLIPSQNDAEDYRQLLQERLRIYNISIYSDR
ncbi:MAG: peptidoglycan-binding protein [Cyanobacteria bacterium SBLK]|nr:peptidoglycan-binding protein [Cyanobacteria bacterium SBLK]